MAISAQSQAIKFEMSLKTFEANAEFMMDELEEEREKVVMAGASAYATSAQRHTPPSLGQPKIAPIFYESLESDHVLMHGEKAHGRRVIYNLREIVRNPNKQRYKKMFGVYLQQGYEYAVQMKNRNGRSTYLKPCRTLDEAKRLSVEDYRGLMRAAWGMGFLAMGKKMPPAFRSLTRLRPKLLNVQNSLAQAAYDSLNVEVTLRNHVIKSGAGFLHSTDINASIAAVRTMDDLMTKFFKRKFEL